MTAPTAKDSSFVDETHYQILQVAPDATLEEIKTAYHRAARQWHPDKQQTNNSHSNPDFRRVQLAWECLRHYDSRQAYDETLRLLAQKKQARQASAIRIELTDCRVEHEDDQQEVWVFGCRCGEELDLFPYEDHLFDCPGCSLTYDTRVLWEDKVQGHRQSSAH